MENMDAEESILLNLKDSWKCKLLPNPKKVQEEITNEFIKVKNGLGKAILLGDAHEGIPSCVAQLDKFVKLNGIAFSKQDHVTFVKILYELMTIPDIAPSFSVKISKTLLTLLRTRKRRKLLSPDDLKLDWRPLYNLVHRVHRPRSENGVVYRTHAQDERNLMNVIQVCKFYFEQSATKEILEELRPYLCPFSPQIFTFAVTSLCIFLPITHEAENSYNLWLNEIFEIWTKTNFCNHLETRIMRLISDLADYNIGLIDWEPYTDIILSRFIIELNAPKLDYILRDSKSCGYQEYVAQWIVSTLGGGSSTQEKLNTVLKAIESGFHSSTKTKPKMVQFAYTYFLPHLTALFIERLKREREQKSSWENAIPKNKMLTDDDITEFVTSLQSHAMYSFKGSIPTMCEFLIVIFRDLAVLKPEMVIPSLLERLYASIDNISAPAKFNHCMVAICGIIRPMLYTGPTNRYSEGRTLILPLLYQLLPLADTNDPRKTYSIFALISVAISMIPVVDCSTASQYHKDLTPEEETICESTALLEQFILVYLDRYFTFLEKQPTFNHLFISSLYAVIQQLSPSIFTEALRKAHHYCFSKVRDMGVTADLVSKVLGVFVQVKGEETLKLMMPVLCTFIIDYMANAEVQLENNLDSELTYNMLLISEISRYSGNAIIPYMDKMTTILQQTLHLRSVSGSKLSRMLLRNLIATLTNTRINEYQSSSTSYSEPISSFLPIRDWGKPADTCNLNIKWYTPGEEEIKIVEQLIRRFLERELVFLRQYVNDEIHPDKEGIHNSLGVIVSCIQGGRIVLQMPNEDEDSMDKPVIVMSDGSNVLQSILNVTIDVKDKLLQSQRDDIASLIMITQIFEGILYPYMMDMCPVEGKKVYSLYVNILCGKYKTTRQRCLRDIQVHHDKRIKSKRRYFTDIVGTISLQLWELSTNDYTQIRKESQKRLQRIIQDYDDRVVDLLREKLIENLNVDTTIHHDRFKGTVHVILARTHESILATSNYGYLKRLLPSLVKSKPSEKLSIRGLLDYATSLVSLYLPALPITIDIPHSIVEISKILTDDELDAQKGLMLLNEKNESSLNDYKELMSNLLKCINEGNLHWPYRDMAVKFMKDLIHPQVPYTPQVLNYILRLLIDDLIAVRKLAKIFLIQILRQYKLNFDKKVVDPYSFSNGKKSDAIGIREDNLWLRYKEELIPRNEDEWNECRYVYHDYVGFYGWPKELKLHEKPGKCTITAEEQKYREGIEKEIDGFFNNEENIKRLFHLYSSEESKEFSTIRCYMFSKIFIRFSDKYLNMFKPYVEKLLMEEDDTKQRIAIEFITSILRGSKFWTFKQTEDLNNWIIPLMKNSLQSISLQNMKDWYFCFSEAFIETDLRKRAPIIELLTQTLIVGDSAVKDRARILLMQTLFAQQWKLTDIFNQLLEIVKPILGYDFQDVRSELSRFLVSIFSTDIEIEGWNRTDGPRVYDFLDYVVPQLQCLLSLNAEEFERSSEVVNGFQSDTMLNGNKFKTAINLFTTVCSWITLNSSRSAWPIKGRIFELMPIVSYMEPFFRLKHEVELTQLCRGTIKSLTYCSPLPADLPLILDVVQKMLESDSRSTRRCCAMFLNKFVLKNLVVISAKSEYVEKINTIVWELLQDSVSEVRRDAADVVCSFIQLNFIPNPSDLIEKCKKLSSIRLNGSTENRAKRLQDRHAGILGLCAFIRANPYDVPDEIPEIILRLGDHMGDPEPIRTHISQTLEMFKLSHHSDWNIHKEKFTSDQLEIFSEIVFPPSYYA